LPLFRIVAAAGSSHWREARSIGPTAIASNLFTQVANGLRSDELKLALDVIVAGRRLDRSIKPAPDAGLHKV
jgi:hypothetical protein